MMTLICADCGREMTETRETDEGGIKWIVYRCEPCRRSFHRRDAAKR